MRGVFGKMVPFEMHVWVVWPDRFSIVCKVGQTTHLWEVYAGSAAYSCSTDPVGS